MPEKESCAVCRFHAPEKSECRRYPPEPNIDNLKDRGNYPKVRSNDFCGEFESKNKGGDA